MYPQALAALATLVSAAPDGNRVELRLDRGSAELHWITPRTFRFRRTLDGPLPPVNPSDAAPVVVEIEDIPDAVRMRSRYVEVTVRKSGLLVIVKRLDGTPLMTDVSEARQAGAAVAWDRQMDPSARYYGLGPRTDSIFDLRGKLQRTDVPFLISTSGCGEYHSAEGAYRFDFTGAGRYRIHAPAIDYFFYYGPNPKQIMQEHRGPAEPWRVPLDRIGSWATLRASLQRIVHASMSAVTQPVFDLRPYTVPPELAQRARQLGSLVAEVTGERSGFRQQLESFFKVYAAEREHKGHPVWHPLPFQFPDDPECALHMDEFMLGDEMLIAPIVAPGNKRSIYLPQGTWTNLETNELIPGRRTIEVETKALPVFARNGSIIPLDSAAGMTLHYFPKLGAEFFLLEADLNAWSAIHAAPAADVIRLQIESRKKRDYQWVVHHVEKPSAVLFEEGTYHEASSLAKMDDRTWFYDKTLRNLHVRVRVAAAEDCVINISF